MEGRRRRVLGSFRPANRASGVQQASWEWLHAERGGCEEAQAARRLDGCNGPPAPLGWQISGDSEPASYFHLWGQGRRPRCSMRVFRGPGLAPQVDLLASKVISFWLWVRGVSIVTRGQERPLLPRWQSLCCWQLPHLTRQADIAVFAGWKGDSQVDQAPEVGTAMSAFVLAREDMPQDVGLEKHQGTYLRVRGYPDVEFANGIIIDTNGTAGPVPKGCRIFVLEGDRPSFTSPDILRFSKVQPRTPKARRSTSRRSHNTETWWYTIYPCPAASV